MNASQPFLTRERARRALLAFTFVAPMLTACGGGGGAGEPATPVRRGAFTVGPTPFAASQHSANLTVHGQVFLIGGSRGESTVSSGIDRFDPATGTITRVGELATGRAGHRATTLQNGAILVSGGFRSMGDSRQAELVSGVTGSAQPAGSMSVARLDHAAVMLADGRVLVTGGNSSGERAPLGISDSAEIWDPATGDFRRLASRMTIGRTAHTATLLPSGKVLLAGGYSWANAYVFAEIFDPAAETFTPVAGGGALRANHVAHALADGRVLVAGGETIVGAAPDIAPVDSVLVYSAATNSWQTAASLRAPRTMAASVIRATGEVLMFGGQRQLPKYIEGVEAYVLGASPAELTPMDAPRALHTATLLADGRVLVAGGEDVGGVFRRDVLLYRP